MRLNTQECTCLGIGDVRRRQKGVPVGMNTRGNERTLVFDGDQVSAEDSWEIKQFL